MPFDQQDCRQTIIDWIDEFNDSIINAHLMDQNRMEKTFSLVDSFWRDALGLTWQLDTYVGNKDIQARLVSQNAAKIGLSNLRLD